MESLQPDEYTDTVTSYINLRMFSSHLKLLLLLAIIYLGSPEMGNEHQYHLEQSSLSGGVGSLL